jgi:tetratricopeptide (TPR) repeat protein
MQNMRRLIGCQLSILLLVAYPAGAQKSSTEETPASTPSVTVTGKVPVDERALPALPPDEFSNCMSQIAPGADVNDIRSFYLQSSICEHQLAMEKHVVIERCINEGGKSSPPAVIQACTESLDKKILVGTARYFVFVNRAEAYLAQGDKQHALDDYNDAIKLAPRNPSLYYNRAVFYAAQADRDAALRDFEAAIGINAKFVPALRGRAKLYQAQDNFNGALADYSEAIRWEPKMASLWCERGYVYIRQKDYESAIKDEAEAIRLDSKLARAYFLRGAAFGDVGDSRNALSDLIKAVDLDPSLDRYVTTKGKTASIALPPI